MNLNLEFWRHLHVWVHLIIEIGSIDCFNSRLKNFDILGWAVSEIADQNIVKSVEMLHFDSEEVIASLRIGQQLVSVDESVVELSLSDEVHELILTLRQLRCVVVSLVLLVIYQILVSVIHLVAVESHLIIFKIYINLSGYKHYKFNALKI